MVTSYLGEKTFLEEDQRRFAALSGDCNPVHLEGRGGGAVVHGIHIVLCALNQLATSDPDLPAVASLKASFSQPVRAGETVIWRLKRRSEKDAIVETWRGADAASRLVVTFGPPLPPAQPIGLGGLALRSPSTPAKLDLPAMAGQSGRVGVPAADAAITAWFPAAARAVSAARLRACLCTTYLVGMVCPGQNSIFGGLLLHASPDPAGDTLGFKVIRADPRLLVCRMEVEGSGVWGTVDSFVRAGP
jgi:hypothetical protein